MLRHTLASSLALVAAAAMASDIDVARQRELVELVRHDCGACHGLTLRGGLGPALTAQALAGKPSPWLTSVILNGRAGTPMPPWRPFLSEGEAAWVVEALKQGTIHAD